MSQADHKAVEQGTGKFGERLEKAAEMLMGCFRVCASDKYVETQLDALQPYFVFCLNFLPFYVT